MNESNGIGRDSTAVQNSIHQTEKERERGEKKKETSFRFDILNVCVLCTTTTSKSLVNDETKIKKCFTYALRQCHRRKVPSVIAVTFCILCCIAASQQYLQIRSYSKRTNN